jgi:hypothetical protein
MATRWAAALTAAALLAACGGDEAETTIAPEVDTLIAAAADAMGTVADVRFTIERTGAPVYLDLGDELGDLIEFQAAEGRYASPGSAEAVVTVGVGGFNTRIGAVAIEGQIWLSLVTGTWQPAPDSYEFDPASLFDPSQGFRQLFATGLTAVTLVGPEDRGGVATYHLRGRAAEERVEAITARLVTNQDVDLDVWLDQATGRIVDAFFTTQVTDGTAEWSMTFREYDAGISIDPPDLGSGG